MNSFNLGKGICWKADEFSVFLREEITFPFIFLTYFYAREEQQRNTKQQEIRIL